MNTALIIGGANGIGLSMALYLSNQNYKIYIIDKINPNLTLPSNIFFEKHDLTITNFSWLHKFKNINLLFISAGIGRVDKFQNIDFYEIDKLFKVNAISVFKILNYFMPNLLNEKDFFCGCMVSISGRIASPLFSIYSATKAALYRGIEAINTELKMTPTPNRILEISPGRLEGTSFTGNPTDPIKNWDLVKKIYEAMQNRLTLFIPQYKEIFERVIKKYITNAEKFAEESYFFKLNNNRLQSKKQLIIGYLSGTFDLFHIGHLNLIRRAREQCDYLVVGVHRDGSHKGKEIFIPFNERVNILKSLKYIDEVIESEKEDSDVYAKGIVKYDKLFVGSDYKGTERFNRYEDYFADKNVQIIYFPYTDFTSSTKIRKLITNKIENI